MRKVNNSQRVERILRKLDQFSLSRIDKLMCKVVDSPEIGKPMRYERKGTREVYASPFRLAYIYDPTTDTVLFLDLYHKKGQ
jgi:mRNA-degrading endonuclease RelE of RelBE toxin-antitoxin system